jgi:predicted metal-dependent phosphoesterase TrpH
MLVDLHCHTSPRSSCSKATLAGLVEAARARGVDALCITEHDILWTEDDLAAASREVGFPLLNGVELSTDVGHVLCYGPLRRPLWQGYRFEELVAETESTGAALVLAHPVRRTAGERAARAGRTPPSAEEVAGSAAWVKAHGVEAFSTQSIPAEHTLTAAALAVAPKPAVAGSDAHDEHNAGAFATRFTVDVRTAADIAAEIRAGRVEPLRLLDTHPRYRG